MKKKKIIYTSLISLLGLTMLTSCDYSNFSLFGFFYNIWENNYENSLKGDLTSNSSTSGTDEETDTSAPKTFYQTSTSTINDIQVEKTEWLVLVNDTQYALLSYQKNVSANSYTTYSQFMASGDYTANGNLIDLGFDANAYVDRSNTASVQYYNGETEDVRKANVKRAFDSDVATVVLEDNGKFHFGSDASTDTVYTGLSTANTYYTYTTDSRPTMTVVSLIDDTNAAIMSFCLNSSNHNQPVSAFYGATTYTKIADSSVDGQYDAIQLAAGRGYDYVCNNGSDMEFDLTNDSTFEQWYKLSIGKTYSLRVTKTGYNNEYDEEVKPYQFEVMNEAYEEPEVEKPYYFKLDGEKNTAIKLTIYKDNTYAFTWDANNVKEEGTWEYGKEDDTLVLVCEDTINTFTKGEDGDYHVHYVSHVSEQLTQDYTIDGDKFTDAFNKVETLLALKGQANEAIILNIFSNGTYHFEFTTYSSGENGTWEYVSSDDTLVLTCNTTKNTFTKQEDGTYKCSYTADVNAALTQDFVITSHDWRAKLPVTIASLTGDKNKEFVLTIYSNGTHHFEYTQYSTSGEDGTWAYDSSKDTITFTVGSKTNVSTKQADGTYLISYVSSKSEQMSQNYTLDAYTFSNIVSKTIISATGEANNAFTMTMFADNTYVFSFSTYNVNEYGTWSYDSTNKKIVFTCRTKTNEATYDETTNTYKLSYVSFASDSMNQNFTFQKDTVEYNCLKSEFDVIGSDNADGLYSLIFYKGGYYKFADNQHGISEIGTYKYDDTNDKIIFQCKNKTNEATLVDGSYTFNYVSHRSSMLTQHFTITSAQVSTYMRKTLVNINKTNTNGTNFTFDFYSNHEYKFSFVNYNVNEYGTWSYDSSNDKFVFKCNNKVNEATKQADGSYLIDYTSDRSSSMTQQYTLSATDAAKLIA